MKLNLLHVLFASVIVLGSSSCEKEDESPNDDPIVGVGESLSYVRTETNSGYSVTYTYDSQARIVRTDYPDGSYGTYSYAGSTLTYKMFDAAGTEIDGLTGQVDANGRVLQYSEGGSVVSFTYNADGQMASQTVDGSSANYTYTGGNLVSVSSADGTETFTYLTDKYETRYTEGTSLLGFPSLNLVATRTSDGEVNTYTYEFDSQNRVTKETSSSPSSGTSVTTYTYW
jgi:YD repeat-containing protein